MPGTIIGGSLQVEGNLNIWTSASISSGGHISATSLSANYIDFNTSATITEHKLGRLHWEDDDKTLDLDLDGGSVLQIGQETLIRAQNNTGSTITNGQVVYINGAQGNRATVGLADADILSASSVIAMATQDITHNNTGFFTSFGLVRDINTSAFTEGVEIYLSSAAGGFTSIKPAYPASVVSIGYVVRSHAVNGSVFFNSQHVSKYEDSTTTPTQLNYLNTTSANIQTQLTNLSATKQNIIINPITGTGTINKIPKFTDTSALGNSLLSEDGTNVEQASGFFRVRNTTSSANALVFTISGDNTSRFLMTMDGTINWGPGGSTPRDVNLYRGGVDILKTDDTFIAPSISATTITVGNIDNTEFQYLNTTSANIQTQLSNLSANKADKTITITAGEMLSGGGDLSTNRTISHQTVGTSGTYSNIVTNSTGHITSARALIAGDLPSGIDATKIADGSVTSTEFQYINTLSANAQTQLATLSATKANTSTTITAGTMLSGGGSLAANRTIAHQTVGTSGTYSNIVTNSTGHITSARNLLSADIPTLPATKIGTGIVNDTEFNYLDGVSANIQTQLTALSGTAHTHSNKALLDVINQSLNTSAAVSFGEITLSAQGGTTFPTTLPPRYIGQPMATDDNWRIYGEAEGPDLGVLVFEVGDNGDEYFLWTSRNFDATRNELMFLDINGLYVSSGLELPGQITSTISNNKALQLNNISLGDNLSADTLWIQGNTNTTKAYLQFGGKTTGGIFGYNGVYFNVDKPINSDNYISCVGPMFSEYSRYQVQTITATANWDSKGSKDIENAGSAYTITLPSEYSDIPFYATTSTLSNTVTVQRSGGDVIHLNGAAGATSITLSANTYYKVIYRSSTGKWYFQS